MSDHRGAWGAREDSVWWPGAIAADQQAFHHQQFLHQQQLAAQQQQQQQQQQQNDVANSTAATQQLFSYKMASTFQQPATTMPSVSSPSAMRGGYDYRLGGGGMAGNGNSVMSGPSPPAPQWWYHGAMDNSMQNSLANPSLQSNVQNMSPVQTPPPPVSQQSQIQTSVQQQQAESQVRQQQAAEAQRQQEAHRQQAETQAARQAEAQAARLQAEAQVRNHQTQQSQLQQQQQQNQLQQQQNQLQHQQQQNQLQHQQQQQNQLQQQNQQHHQQNQHTQTLHQSLQQNHQSVQHHQSSEHQQPAQQQKQIQQQILTVQVPSRGRMPRGKADARPRGRMTAYAFFVQTCREEHKKKHPEENVVFAEFSKKCAERWKTMLDKEKKRFHEMAEKDKKRYDAEMQNYTPPKGEKQRGKKRKQIKDPNAPKRALSAFFWFCNDERSKVKSQNPEFGVGDIAKELGRRWAEADSDIKSKYEAMAEKDKARYEKEMTAYKKKNNPSMPAAPVPDPEEEDDEEEEVEEDEDE